MKGVVRWILPILTLLTLVFIFSNSLEPQKKAEAKRQEVVDLVQDATGSEKNLEEKALALISKCFHVAEFALFSFLLSLQVIASGRERGYESVLLCGVICALADEQLQLIAAGRGSRLSDVLVDLAGVMLGYGVAYLLLRLKRRRGK